jgi:hypothetical protein
VAVAVGRITDGGEVEEAASVGVPEGVGKAIAVGVGVAAGASLISEQEPGPIRPSL